MALNATFYRSSATSGSLICLGGAISATTVTSGAIFLDTPASGNGLTGIRNYNKTPLYRCLYLKNTAAVSWSNVSLTITQGNSLYYSMGIAPSAAGLNASAETIATEATLPNITGVFSSSINFGTIPNNQYYAFWIRMIGTDYGSGGNGGWILKVTAQY
jgi:hypothetical protein